MSVRIVFQDFPKICRLCLMGGNLHPISKTNTWELFSSMIHIEEEENYHMPENICEYCATQLDAFTVFIENCRTNERILRSIVCESKNKTCESDECETSLKNELYTGDYVDKTKGVQASSEENKERSGKDILDLANCEDLFSSTDGNEHVESDSEFYQTQSSTEGVNRSSCRIKIVKKTKKPKRVKIRFPCDYCDKFYVQKKRLEMHLRSHKVKLESTISSSVKNENNEDIKEEVVSEPDITCLNANKTADDECEETPAVEPDFCQDDYNLALKVTNIVNYLTIGKERKVKKKLRLKHEDPTEEPEIVKGRRLKGKRRFLCNYCGKNYTRKNGLERHILSHTGVKEFECRECGKRYTTKDTLKTHMLTHSGVKAHKCEVCQKSFTQSSHLSYHMRRHTGDKPFSCSFCGKGFLSSYHLERHKLMHTGVKPYECELCGKHFVRKTTLRDHRLIHTGEKPFQCQHCGKQFNRKQSLTNHMLVHGGQTKNSGVKFGTNLLYGELNIPDVSNVQTAIVDMIDS